MAEFGVRADPHGGAQQRVVADRGVDPDLDVGVHDAPVLRRSNRRFVRSGRLVVASIALGRDDVVYRRASPP